jgi:hypothetical protein
LSIRVLGQAGVVSEVVTLSQMIGRSLEVIPLERQLGHAHVHVGRPAQDRRPVGRHPQAVLVSPHRLVQTTLGEADLRQRSVATDRIDGVARTLQGGHRLRPEAMGRLEVAVPPVREGEEARPAGAPERIVVTGQIEGPPSERLRPLRSPSSWAWAARYRATALGNRENSSSSITTIAAGLTWVKPVSDVGSSHRSVPRRSASTSATSPWAMSVPT